jgi:hypothetical protein
LICGDVCGFEPNLLSLLKGYWGARFTVVMFFHFFSFLFQGQRSFLPCSFQVFREDFDIRYSGFSLSCLPRPWMLSAHRIKWSLFGAGVSRIVMSKFRDVQPVLPIILSVVDEGPQEFFDILVDAFRLAISLRVIRCRDILFDA